MKKYLSFFRMRFIHGLQYRSAALAGVITQFTWGFMEILLFRAFYEADPSAFPMEFSALSCYVWLQQAFLALYMTWFWEEDIFRSIRDGSICYELCRPLNLYNLWFTRTIAVRLSKAVLRCMPILVVTNVVFRFSLFTVIVPPCKVIIFWAIANPRPAPPVFPCLASSAR